MPIHRHFKFTQSLYIIITSNWLVSMELVLTAHAKERMAQYAITKEQVKEAIQKGATVKQTDGWLSSYTCIKVAYRKIGPDTYKIKTVFIE